MNIKNQKGFTLIELLVVIAIIGLLSTMSVVALNSARQKSRDAKRLSDMKQIQTALELYYTDANIYPSGTDNPFTTSTGMIAYSGNIYMASVPSNPSPRADGSCTDSNYIYMGGGTTYSIYYCLGEATGGLTAGKHYANPAGL